MAIVRCHFESGRSSMHHSSSNIGLWVRASLSPRNLDRHIRICRHTFLHINQKVPSTTSCKYLRHEGDRLPIVPNRCLHLSKYSSPFQRAHLGRNHQYTERHSSKFACLGRGSDPSPKHLHILSRNLCGNKSLDHAARGESDNVNHNQRNLAYKVISKLSNILMAAWVCEGSFAIFQTVLKLALCSHENLHVTKARIVHDM